MVCLNNEKDFYYVPQIIDLSSGYTVRIAQIGWYEAKNNQFVSHGVWLGANM